MDMKLNGKTICSSSMRVAVIGAGVSGLIATKICLDYGFEVVCFEKLDNFGGLWRYKSTSVAGEASIMKSIVINSSKEMMAFSDFPPSADSPNYMRHSDVLKYITSYVDRFNLKVFIKFCVEVQQIRRSDDYDKTGQWVIVYRLKGSAESVTDTFSSVLIATGHHAYPQWPKLEGIENFKGRVMHSHGYKDQTGFDDKRILVVGIGNSGGDVVVELGRVASQVYLSTRTGCWCLNRTFAFGYPLDMIMQRRLKRWLLNCAPGIMNSMMEFVANCRFDHRLYGLACKHRIFQQHPMVNDDLPNRIISGSVVVKPNISRFLANGGVLFDDRSEVHDIDDVIMCTGYDIALPMLEKQLAIVDDQNLLNLYKFMYPPQLDKWPTLCLIGFVQPYGAVMPVSEIQARFHCEHLLMGIGKEDMIGFIPSRSEMQRQIEADRAANVKRYGTSRRHTIQLDYVPYMDDLARLIGVDPPTFWSCALQMCDLPLALKLAFGPVVPYQFRLRGRHAWPGARDALLTTWDRALAPLRAGRRENQINCNSSGSKDDSNFHRFSLCHAILFFLFVTIFFHLCRILFC